MQSLGWRTLPPSDIDKALNFAIEAWSLRSQSPKQFGTYYRGPDEFIADQTEGKLAELIVQRTLQLFDISIELDWEHYRDPLVLDDGDVRTGGQHPGPRIDIKGSGPKARWLLVEDHKFFNPGYPSERRLLSDAFIMVKFNSFFPGNRTLRKAPGKLRHSPITGRIVGWATVADFFDQDGVAWFTFPKGDRLYAPAVIPDITPMYKSDLSYLLERRIAKREEINAQIHIGPPLDAKLNYALPIKWLRRNREGLFRLFNSHA